MGLVVNGDGRYGSAAEIRRVPDAQRGSHAPRAPVEQCTVTVREQFHWVTEHSGSVVDVTV